MLHKELIKDVNAGMVDGILLLTSKRTDIEEDTLTWIALESVRIMVTSAGEKAMQNITNLILKQ